MVFTYVAVVTSGANERNYYMSAARLASTIGLVFSPGILFLHHFAIFFLIILSFSGVVFILGFVRISITKSYVIDQYNASGWIVAIVCLIFIVYMYFFFLLLPIVGSNLHWSCGWNSEGN